MRTNKISITNVRLSYGTELIFTLKSDFPLTSPISIDYNAFGTYFIENSPGNEENPDWQGYQQSTVLESGESSWEISYSPNLETGGSISYAFCHIFVYKFSDDYFSYESGKNTYHAYF